MTDSGPDRAAAALQRAGYRAGRSRAKPAGLDPNDDFLEAEIEVSQADEATIDAVNDQIEAIAKPFGGFVEMWGATEDGHLPFEGIFGIKQMRHAAHDHCADWIVGENDLAIPRSRRCSAMRLGPSLQISASSCARTVASSAPAAAACFSRRRICYRVRSTRG
jgi:hypothetical protein